MVRALQVHDLFAKEVFAASGMSHVHKGAKLAAAASFVPVNVPITGTIKIAFRKSHLLKDLRKAIQTRRRDRDSNPRSRLPDLPD
jgi:hypothetical protein